MKFSEYPKTMESHNFLMWSFVYMMWFHHYVMWFHHYVMWFHHYVVWFHHCMLIILKPHHVITNDHIRKLWLSIQNALNIFENIRIIVSGPAQIGIGFRDMGTSWPGNFKVPMKRNFLLSYSEEVSKWWRMAFILLWQQSWLQSYSRFWFRQIRWLVTSYCGHKVKVKVHVI